jgi:hypothetical protein
MPESDRARDRHLPGTPLVVVILLPSRSTICGDPQAAQGPLLVGVDFRHPAYADHRYYYSSYYAATHKRTKEQS